jgi:hypothetical protein
LDRLEESLRNVGVAVEDVQYVMAIVKHSAESINKRYVKGEGLASYNHNKLARVGRKLYAAKKSPAFAQACLAFENIKATAKFTETVTGAFLLNSLSTDQAWSRLKKIEEVVSLESRKRGKIDPALLEAISQSEVTLLAARSKIGAFAVSVNDNIEKLTDSAMNLGVTLAEMSAKLSAPLAMWVAAPQMTYNTLRHISDQWEMAQDGVTLATLARLFHEHGKGVDNITNSIHSYAQLAFYAQIEETFSVGAAKFKDFLSPGQTNKDWVEYYKKQKQNSQVIAVNPVDASSATNEPLGLAGKMIKPNPCNLEDKEVMLVAEVRISDICRVKDPVIVHLQFRSKNQSVLEYDGWYEVPAKYRQKFQGNSALKSIGMDDSGKRGDKYGGDGVYTYSQKLSDIGFVPGSYDVWIFIGDERFSGDPDRHARVHIGTLLVR